MVGSSWFSAGSSIRFYLLANLVAVQTGVLFDAFFQFVAGAERHHAARRNGYLFAGFGITSGTRVFLAQREVAETGQLYVVALGQRGTHFVEKQLDKLLCLPLVQAQFIEQSFRQV